MSHLHDPFPESFPYTVGRMRVGAAFRRFSPWASRHHAMPASLPTTRVDTDRLELRESEGEGPVAHDSGPLLLPPGSYLPTRKRPAGAAGLRPRYETETPKPETEPT